MLNSKKVKLCIFIWVMFLVNIYGNFFKDYFLLNFNSEKLFGIMLSALFIPIIFLIVSIIISNVIGLLGFYFPKIIEVIDKVVRSYFIITLLVLLSLFLGLLNIVPSAEFFLGYTIGLLG